MTEKHQIAGPGVRSSLVTTADRAGRAATASLMVGALGVVFGDIGTSPLYALQTVFALDGGIVQPTTANVFGVVSLVFWSITLIVSAKYLGFILRADNDGEGGVMALAHLAARSVRPCRGPMECLGLPDKGRMAS